MYRDAIRLNPDDGPVYKHVGLVLRSEAATAPRSSRSGDASWHDDPQAGRRGATRAELAKLEQQP